MISYVYTLDNPAKYSMYWPVYIITHPIAMDHQKMFSSRNDGIFHLEQAKAKICQRQICNLADLEKIFLKRKIFLKIFMKSL